MKPLHFKKGALHEQLNVPGKDKIPASKMRAALNGSFGALARKRAEFAKNVLVGRK